MSADDEFDGDDVSWKPKDECVAQWPNGLFYSGVIVRVLADANGRKSYAVTSEDKQDDIVVTADQLRTPDDRPIIRVQHKLTEAKALEIASKELPKAGVSVPASAMPYVASQCMELVNKDRCLDIDSWFFRMSPLLMTGLGAQEDAVWKVCNGLVKTLVPLVGARDGDRRRSSEVVRDNENTLLHISKLTLGYMGKILLIRTSMHLIKGHRYGVVGENGAGKTTLMRKIASGTLPGFPKWIKTVYVQPDFDTDTDYITAFDYLSASQKEEQGEDCDVNVVNTLMDDLQFTEKLKNSLIKELSGGWKMRVALARATMMRADILLLDEPTNHLDVNAVKWLEGYLRSISTTVMVISHEPAFLDRVVTDVLYMKNRQLNHYVGNFSAFTAQQSGFSQADLEASAISGPSDALRFRFPDPGELVGINSRTRAVLTAKNVTFAYDQKKGNVLKGVKARLDLSSRIAVCGPNGAGKSTLVKLLVGELEPQEGTIWRHINLRISYVAQHSFSHLEKVRNKAAIAYIRQRFVRGFDSENCSFKVSEEDEYKADKDSTFAHRKVEAILGRRKFKNSVAYEVKWEGLPDNENSWLTEMKLAQLGAKHLAKQCDEKIRSKKSGIDQRPLTNKEITRHLGDFGLDKQYANAKIEGLSGGQKCKLVLAGAMWNKPHMLVLDEPTNYLDLDALQALAKAINKYKGGVIMVSHNKDFIGEICTKQWDIADGVIAKESDVIKVDKEVIETCDVPTVDKGYDGSEQLAKEAAAKAAAALLPVGVGKLLGPKGLASKNTSERREAVTSLLERQSATNFGGQEARKNVFQACMDTVDDADDEVWCDVLKLGKNIANSIDQTEAGKLLSLLDEATSKLASKASGFDATAKKENAAAHEKEAAKWHVGERVKARYAGDGQMYDAEILKVHPREQGFDIIFVDYNEKAKVKCSDVERVASGRPTTNQPNARKPTSSAAKEAEAESAKLNRGRAGLLTWKSALALRLQRPDNNDKVAAAALEIIDVMSQSATAGNLAARKANSTTMSVHEALSKSLSPLMSIGLDLDTQSLLQKCFDSAVSSEREEVSAGAAHCLAAILEGAGPKAMHDFGLIDKLGAMLDKGASEHERKAALLIYPRLFSTLGASIEYKVADFLPALLNALKDRNKEVVAFAEECSRVLMSSLSIHGARIILPILLEGLKAKDWKTKVQNIAVLEAVAFCSEDLMSEELPIIVPELTEVMTSPRKEVQKAAEKAFDQIGSIIANPEIKPLVPAILDALRDANKNTQEALETLTHTSFAYAVDAPSLALLMPVVFNGMKDRKLECKKAAMKVVDALCSLVMDVKYLEPYAEDLLARLKTYLVYSMPDVRAIAAKALGVLFSEMGEDYFPDLLTYLVESLKGTNVTPHEISGAARGLCYCCYALGVQRTKELLPNLMQQTKSDSANVRAGHFELFVVMPEVFEDSFRTNFFESLFPVTLAGLTDKALVVQEAAMAASQELVSRYARTNLQYMLPFLMKGLSDPDAKVRTLFLQLMGTLTLNIVLDTNYGQTLKFWGHGNALAEDEIANEATEEQEEMVKAAMGEEDRNETFAKMYLMRSDDSEGVGQMAWRVWHLTVPQERPLLFVLLQMLIDRIVTTLSTDNAGRKKQARSSLSHLVLSLGDAGLAKIVPMLHEHLKSDDSRMRVAVCISFSEVMRSASKEDIGAYLNEIIPSIRDMLVDPVPSVRPAAAAAFQQLYKNVGSKAIDKMVPLLLDTLREGKHTDSLVDGVTTVLDKCETNAYFNLSLRIFTTLEETTDKNSIHYLMRDCLVKGYCAKTKTAEGMELVRTFKALQLVCEQMPSIKAEYFDLFALNTLNKIMDGRGNIRASSRMLLVYAFGFHEDAEAAQKSATAFFTEKEVRDESQAEFLEVMASTTPQSEMGQSLDAEDAPSAGAAGGEKSATGTMKAMETQTSISGEVLGKDEKRCAGCKKVLKVKAYSKKQFKHDLGKCKMCA